MARKSGVLAPNPGRDHIAVMINTSYGLTRDTSRAMLGGVCAGLARWLDWDVTVVRFLYVVGSVASVAFPGLLVYALLWAIMPRSRP